MEEKVLIKRDLKEEIEFALEHKVQINAFGVKAFPEKEVLQEICDETKVEAQLRPSISQDAVFYVLNFLKDGALVASYYGNNLLDKEMNYALSPAEFTEIAEKTGEVVDLDK